MFSKSFLTVGKLKVTDTLRPTYASSTVVLTTEMRFPGVPYLIIKDEDGCFELEVPMTEAIKWL